MQAVDLIKQFAQELDLAQIVDVEQAGAKAVVNVMGVIGDVVGKRRALRLGAGVEFKIEWKYFIEFQISSEILCLA